MADLKDYYCVKAVYIATTLTSSVNVLKKDTIEEVYSSALRYFKEQSWPYNIHELILYESESDMHSGRQCIGVYRVNENAPTKQQNPPLEGREATYLTKENFWNNLSEKYPDQMKSFCTWIDEYKKKVDWERLFSDTGISAEGKTKYHDLPIAMQIGIFIQYCMETPHRYELVEGMPATMQVWQHTIKGWMEAEASPPSKGGIIQDPDDLKNLNELYHPDNFTKN